MARRTSLSLKIFLGTAAVVAAVLGATLYLTDRSANRTADAAIARALAATRDQVDAILAAREQALRSGAEVFVKNAPFIAVIEQQRAADALDQAMVAVASTGATWVEIAGRDGVRMAKSDDPGAPADTIGYSPAIGTALQGQVATGYLATDEALLQSVAVPIVTAGGAIVGALMATRAVDADLAAAIKRASAGTDVVFYALDADDAPRVVAASLDGEPPSLGGLGGDDEGMAGVLERGDQHFVALGRTLRNAAGEARGGYVALRSREAELAPFVALRQTILLAGGVGLVAALVLALLLARGVTRPVQALVAATRRAAQGDYSADITVRARDEIGTLADAFRAMLADLRDKAALVEFLQSDGGGRTVQLGTMSGTMAHAAASANIAPGQVFADRYDVKEMLGVGGMGVVFRAHDAKLDEPVAIKTLKADILGQDPSALERFKSEIRLARKITQRNVVRTHDLGEWGGAYYITMEYVEGKSLKDLVRARGRLPTSAVLTIGKQLCRALEAAHEQGVIHRDIKPQNIVVQPDGVLKVMDFGIARLADRKQGVTQAGMVVGTPEYMAPEQLLGDEVDARVDLYAAGVVLYECLTGRLPFSADSPITLITKVLEETPPAPRTVHADVPEALSLVVMAAMHKEPAHRLQTAAELHDRLAAIG